MTQILVLNSSILGDSSASKEIVSALMAKHATGASIVERDLGADPVPHLTTDSATAIVAQPATPAAEATRALSTELLTELRAADVLIIGAPMYNFGISSSLKAWFDHVVRAGETFAYSESGPEGLLKNKRAYVVISRGGVYSEGAAQALDFQEPYLRLLLGFIGISDVTFIRAEKLALGAEARSEALLAAKQQVAELA